MKSWITAISIAVLTSLVCALLVATNEEPENEAGSATSLARPAPARERSASGSSGAQAAASDDEAASPGEATAPSPSPAAPPAPTSEDVREQIGGAFQSERVDTTWDGAELARLEKALPALLPTGSQITRVECRSTMCRIESTHAGVEQFTEFARTAFLMEKRVNEGPFFASVTAPPVPGQPVTTVAYLARKGHILPMPERIATAR